MNYIDLRSKAVAGRLWLVRFLMSIGSFCVVSTPATAVEVIIMDIEVHVLDLDSGTLIEEFSVESLESTGGDFKLAYNADRLPHAVVFPVAESIETAYVADVGFDGVSAADIPAIEFSAEPMDLPLSINDCVIIRTDQGALYKVGNARENGYSVTLNYAELQ